MPAYRTAQDIADIMNATLGKAIEPNERIRRFALKAWNTKPQDIFTPILANSRSRFFLAKERNSIILTDSLEGLDYERYLLVDDVEEAITKLAKHQRELMTGEIIGITGSAGKSTTKTMLAHVLKNVSSVFDTSSNQNLTTFTKASLATLNPKVHYAIFELAMYDKDTVNLSAELVKPNIAMVTSIGFNHAENVGGTIEDIINAKTKLFDHLTGRGLVILPSQDPHFESLLQKAKNNHNVHEIVTVGENPDDYVQLENYKESITGSQISAKIEGQSIQYFLPQPGVHFIRNSLLVLAAIGKMGLDPNLIKTIKDYETPNSSIERFRVHFTDGREVEIFDDSIISSPHQVEALLQILKKRDKVKRKVLIFGDMTALGENSAALHEGLAESIDSAGFDLVITAGKYSEKMAHKLSTPHITFPDTRYAAEAILPLIKNGDLIAIKASGPTKMKLVTKKIYANSKRNLAKSWTVEGS